jgi:UDP-N-acetylmuramate dehydrogenase
MAEIDPIRLSALTTLQTGAAPARMIDAATEDELVSALRAVWAARDEWFVLGGGSNLFAGDAPFDGTVIRIRTHGIEELPSPHPDRIRLRAQAGHDWDALVAYAVECGYAGIEAMSGIPGTVGAAPVQNIGAYGQEVAQTIASVRTWDRARGRVRTLALSDLQLSYRGSLLKRSMRATPSDEDPAAPWWPTPRYVVLDVTLQLRQGTLSAPIAYAELARTLGVELGARAPLGAVRAAVLSLRAGKGMVLDPSDHDTWSAGSFFTNPLLTPEQAAQLPPDAPRFPLPDDGARDGVPGGVKTSAAWLIDHAGFTKGFGDGPARLSGKHVLALTNRGGATAADLLALARTVRDGVARRFGVVLEPEPVLVGAAL